MQDYMTLIVHFVTGKSLIDDMSKEIVNVDFKEWIDSYESSRCTWVNPWTCVITSEYNMECIQEWFFKHFKDFFNYWEEN